MNKNIYFLSFLISNLIFIGNFPIQHVNFFEPYEYLLDANRVIFNKKGSFQGSLRFEYGFNFRGYPVDTKDILLQGYNCRTVKSNVAQYLDLYESDFAPFLGSNEDVFVGQFAQQGTPYSGQTASQLLFFDGNLALLSATLNAEYWINKHVKIGYYVPFYSIQLKTLSHHIDQKKKYFENALLGDIFSVYQSNAYHVGPYSLFGVGDSELLISWQRYFYENRDFISGIFASLRAGLYLPTVINKSQYMQTFLKIPLGYDAAWGIPFGGSLEIDINLYGGAGISADCIAFFGQRMNRYVKTDMRQTDMLTLENVSSFVQPGVKESFSVYGVLHNLEKTLMTTIAYQYNKQNESDIMLCNVDYSNFIAQSSNFLDSWTNHNVLFLLEGLNAFSCFELGYEFFVKLGLSGCRSIVSDTCGFSFTIKY